MFIALVSIRSKRPRPALDEPVMLKHRAIMNDILLVLFDRLLTLRLPDTNVHYGLVIPKRRYSARFFFFFFAMFPSVDPASPKAKRHHLQPPNRGVDVLLPCASSL